MPGITRLTAVSWRFVGLVFVGVELVDGVEMVMELGECCRQDPDLAADTDRIASLNGRDF